MVWSVLWRMVGVDNRSDFPGRGLGGCPPGALHGNLRARLGRPSWGHISGNLDICGRSPDGVGRVAQDTSDRLIVVPMAPWANACGGVASACARADQVVGHTGTRDDNHCRHLTRATTMDP